MATKILYVGDVHATPSELPECWKLIEYIKHIAVADQPKYIIFLGDQYHTHAIMHLSVLEFWRKAFDFLTSFPQLPTRDYYPEIIALIGNHDQPGDKTATAHAMIPHYEQINVVDDFQQLLAFNGAAAIPYRHSPKDFVEEVCNAWGNHKFQVLICHQTFMGAEYDNGFFPDGIDPKTLPVEQIISGHIHKPQIVGKVWYVGSPRWRTINDANQERAIWTVTHDDDGKIIERVRHDTSGICKPIYLLEDTPETPVKDLDPKASIVIDIKGPAEYVAKRKLELAGNGVRLRCFPTNTRTIEVKESDGITIAFGKFLKSYKPLNGTNFDVLKKMCEERITWARHLS